MRSILQELWHGNICPQTDSRNNSLEMKQLMEYMARHHDDKKFADEVVALTKTLVSKLWTLLQGKTSTGIKDYFGVELYAAGAKFSVKMLEDIARKSMDETSRQG